MFRTTAGGGRARVGRRGRDGRRAATGPRRGSRGRAMTAKNTIPRKGPLAGLFFWLLTLR